MNTYEISFPDFFRNNPDYSKTVSGKTAGAAKYTCYLEFSDAYDMTFFQFLKFIKCRKVGGFKASDLFGNSDLFEDMKNNRNLEFASMGMRVEVAGDMGTIVGSHGFNLLVCFDGKWHGENCHPWWETKYFDKKGNIVRNYTKEAVTI
ncbi:hypothetical protein BK133_05185 [Paenibacillus sp. FSL H8-0548]|uniref:hypothetical protein n=1 Tax=Paenibacillus sp. FSL H8-0548 TaxID=1920422 RepID=UPI00096FD71F|nr:hypothetical protein [Paenibacillus sp. FSL H8-0548]OMF37451.1 hypothetical protein BK133_05185 [Paenibacillus sp. FSL H8-0548]